ncbi:hypothetical protein, partial [Streptococcus pneumoniae]|uniref:hypothetical protein n=1 Tax=Streptococcus pneumoniae TaxID=1313 RepID=UPI001CB76F34
GVSALEPLLEFLSIPSVSTDPAHKEDVRKAALWSGTLRSLGRSAAVTQEARGRSLAGVEEIMRLRSELEALQARFEAEVARLKLLLLEEGKTLPEGSSMGA